MPCISIAKKNNLEKRTFNLKLQKMMKNKELEGTQISKSQQKLN